MNKQNSVVIVSAKRSPIGSFQGAISTLPAAKLGSLVISKILEDTMIDHLLIDEVIMGNVLSAGSGQAPARQAALAAGLSDTVECLTINKMCGSGLKAVMLAAQAIQVKDAMFKFYITAGIKTRATRRFKEYKALKKQISFKEVLKSIRKRDKLDRTRKYGPLKKTKDSILINTTKLSKKACFMKIKDIMDRKLKA